jgi:hypothetical protein
MRARARDLDALADVFLTCRAMGHSWEPRVTYRHKVGRRLVDEQVWFCSREAAAKIDPPTEKRFLSASEGRGRGELLSTPSYDHAEGYLLEPGQVGRGRSRPTARATLMDRIATDTPKRLRVVR